MPDDPRRLHILRHAKSSSDSPTRRDEDRPLAPRGIGAATAMAARLEELTPPDLVLCSSARRAVETLAHLRPALPPGVPVLVEAGLYGADAPALLVRLRELPEGVATVLLIGHNPGLEDLALGLTGDGEPDLIARVRSKFPTAALASVTFTGGWKDLAWGQATIDAFVVPNAGP